MTLQELMKGPPIRTNRSKLRILNAVKQLGWTTALVVLEDGTKQELLSKVGRALKFPSHYGQNWDALQDCLSSVEAKGGVMLEIRGVEKLDPSDRAMLDEVIEDAAAVHAEARVLLRVLLVSSPAGTS